MPTETRKVAPGPEERTVRFDGGRIVEVPEGWASLPPGDATWTRRVKAGGPTWTVQEKRGRKVFSRGVWAPEDTIEAVRVALEAERATPAYQKKLAAGRKRSAVAQEAYVEDFRGSVVAFLDFHPVFALLADAFADAVTAHATPVGSGTVARTKRIPVTQRAEAAVIAWMRHQTTAYDDMKIARVKGERRRVRRELAQRSKRLLAGYRAGTPLDAKTCPLARSLTQI